MYQRGKAQVFESEHGTAIWGPISPSDLRSLVEKAKGRGHVFPDVHLAQQVGALMVWRSEGDAFQKELGA